MNFTQRCAVAAGFTVMLAIAAVVFGRWFPLVGAVGIGTWLVANQYVFARAVRQVDSRLEVNAACSQKRVIADEPIQVTCTASLVAPVPVTVTLSPQVPPVASDDPTPQTGRIAPGEREARTTHSLSFPVTGSFQLPPVEVTVSDKFGLFRETFEQGLQPEIVVEPPAPTDIHIGRRDEVFTGGFGDQEREQTGMGLDPERLREYVPTDAAKQIDWKATARRNELYAWEYGRETEHDTTIIIDQQRAMRVGSAGRTKLDYAREIALALARTTLSNADTFDAYVVDDQGVTRVPTDDYLALLDVLDRQMKQSAPVSIRPQRATVLPAEHRRMAAQLADDPSPFARQLRSYLGQGGRRVSDPETAPLLSALRTSRRAQTSTYHTVILTDDSEREEVRQTVTRAAEQKGIVSVFLTVNVLFESGGLSDLDTAYQRYLEFEDFRQSLEVSPDVRAFEVGPKDRIEAILGSSNYS